MRGRKYINRIDVYQVSAVSDGFGGNILSEPVLIGSSWCNIKTLRAERVTDLGLSENDLIIEVNLRYRDDLNYTTKNMFFRYRGVDYNLLRIEHINLDRLELKILAASNGNN